MRVIDEARHLAALSCGYEPGMGAFVFSCEGRRGSAVASEEDIAALFRAAHVKDEATEPASARGRTYAEMARAVMDGSDRRDYIWSGDVDAFFDGLAALDRKSRGVAEGRMFIAGLDERAGAMLARAREAAGLPAIARAAGVSTDSRIVSVGRRDTIYATVMAMGLPCKINAMRNVVAEVPDMKTAGAALQTIYRQFGVKGSFMVTWEGKGKLYWAPTTPVDKKVAMAYAKSAGLPPPDPRGYLERRRGRPGARM